MEVKLAVLADYANMTQDNKLNILGLFDTICARNFPIRHNSMQLIITFESPLSEANTVKDLKIILMDADGKRIFEMGGPFKLGAARDKMLAIKASHIIILNGLVFEKDGDYSFDIQIGGDTKKSVPLKVRKLE